LLLTPLKSWREVKNRCKNTENTGFLAENCHQLPSEFGQEAYGNSKNKQVEFK